MQDLLISMALSTLITIIRDPNGRGKWRKALLKVFREIAIAFKDDAELTLPVETKPTKP